MHARLAASAVALAMFLAPAPTRAANCAGDSTGLVPLIDLGTGSYMGYEGGLYAGGSNLRPAAHEAAGLAIATGLAPLDTLGNPDLNGRVVLISIGMSNCTQEFSTFIPKANADPRKRSNVRVIDCALGGQAANLIRNPAAAYWDTVDTRLRGHGSSPQQAQVVWLKEANSGPTGGFPAATLDLMNNLGAIVRIIHDRLPNVRLCYFTSRIYAGYATTTLNPEPYAYESGFAVKWLIDAQIQGVDSLEFDPGQGPVEAPWLSWGPYLWADGLEPRAADGLTWACNAFATDGTHPSSIGRNVVADSLLAFFERDATTVPWFLNATVSAPAPSPTRKLGAWPNPARSAVELSWPAALRPSRIDVLDAGSRRVRVLRALTGTTRARWDLADERGRRVAPGLYWLRVDGSKFGAARVLVLGD